MEDEVISSVVMDSHPEKYHPLLVGYAKLKDDLHTFQVGMDGHSATIQDSKGSFNRQVFFNLLNMPGLTKQVQRLIIHPAGNRQAALE